MEKKQLSHFEKICHTVGLLDTREKVSNFKQTTT